MKYLRSDGYEQLSEYVNARTKIKMRCPKGHIFEILPHNWKRGTRCGICYRNKLRKRKPVKLSDIIDSLDHV